MLCMVYVSVVCVCSMCVVCVRGVVCGYVCVCVCVCVWYMHTQAWFPGPPPFSGPSKTLR